MLLSGVCVGWNQERGTASSAQAAKPEEELSQGDLQMHFGFTRLRTHSYVCQAQIAQGTAQDWIFPSTQAALQSSFY